MADVSKLGERRQHCNDKLERNISCPDKMKQSEIKETSRVMNVRKLCIQM